MAVDSIDNTVVDQLADLMRHRLHDNETPDQKEPVYSRVALQTFLQMAVSAFNSIPPFTYFSLADKEFCIFFADVLVSHAVGRALASQALIERGREFDVDNGGIKLVPPFLSEILWAQSVFEIGDSKERMILAKQSEDFISEWWNSDWEE